ncbi:cupin domain-containing protein [Allorhizocola rhizosphaerae]|uniref:cupin domain-containing protein n=1 Tax=Allorhizocola rhizosphaerae TaxID=1872709 RepID=UPI001B8A9158|nr:cupin domain-containing protein [Allorhizocola rhizosphaerae]
MKRLADAAFEAGWRAGRGLTRWPAIGEHTPGAVHTEFEVCVLEPGGSVEPAVQSFEECFFILEGTPQLRTESGGFALHVGDYGLIPVGSPHAWHNPSAEPARWAAMRSPQPRAGHDFDTYSVPPLPDGPFLAVDPRDPRTRRLGHIEPSNMDARSVSMNTALLVYSGIAVKMMVDTNLGAQLNTMFMVHYEPEGVAGAHDHPFEETYMFLEGEAEAVFDDQTYRLGPGDIAFAGVGCVHGFRNVGEGPLRWLETQAPQPPARHSYRFVRDWAYLSSIMQLGYAGER